MNIEQVRRATISAEVIRDRYSKWQESILRGTSGNWHYFRVWPDGEVTTGEEASRCLPEAEHFQRVPHPITLDEDNSIFSPNPDDGFFEWEGDCFGEYEMLEGGKWSKASEDSPKEKRFKLGQLLDEPKDSISERFDTELLPKLREWGKKNGVEIEE